MAELFLVDGREARLHERHDGLLQDAAARCDALRVDRSWIVEAPAGSGKTGLLIQRYLKLLATENVDQPEQVLAVTFTEKATAEMRERVLAHLEGATLGSEVGDEFEQATRRLAEAVLRKDRERGWGLRGSPARLNIRTIHSVSAEIAGSLPILSGSGGRLHPVADASGLYNDAARRTLMQLGGDDAALDTSLRILLLHRDGNLSEVERLIAGMLERRDQWGELVSLSRGQLEDSYLDGEVLPRLERALEVAICSALGAVAKALPAHLLQALTDTAAAMGQLNGYNGGASPIAVCAGKYDTPEERTDHLAHWRALMHLLVPPSQKNWRRGFNKNQIFFETDQQGRGRLRSIVQDLEGNDELLRLICAIGCLPPAKYPAEQWEVTKALFRVLSRALVELQILFAERDQCDFAELELAAKAALRDEAGSHDLAETLGMRIEHLLVDEMQDTSSGQYELIERLTQGWDGSSQTVFLVGDPKQSIYLFRQARVERFLRAMRTERVGDLTVGCLRLTANFRSQARLVEGFNDDFSQLFPLPGRGDAEEVTYTEASATRGAAGDGRAWHTTVLPYIADTAMARGSRNAQRRADAREIRRVVEEWRARPLPKGRTKPWTMAVLVRGREHLREIVAALSGDAGASPLPFRAVEIEPLKDRQIVLDLVAITRALLHPGDRVGWLAVLHAPWCGLGLADLHMLAGADDPQFERCCIEDLIERRGDLLSEEGIARLQRLWPVLQAAARQRGRLTTAQWVERTWRSLGGDAYASDAEISHARRYLRLLDEIEQERGAMDLAMLELRLNRLYAEPSASEDALDLITIHGAKGLEWDVVIVPALERGAGKNRGGLLTWVELDSSEEDAAHVVLAPIETKGSPSKELRDWIATIHKDRDAAERKRLFYVACTRAREALHLFATRESSKDGRAKYAKDSLLAAAWPAAERYFGAPFLVTAVPGSLVEMGQPDEALADYTQPDEALTLAAAGDELELEDPAANDSAKLFRLPLTFDAQARFSSIRRVPGRDEPGRAPGRSFERPEGSYAARAFGNAMHAFLEMLTRRFADAAAEKRLSAEDVLLEVANWGPRIEALLRGDGLPPAMVERLAVRVRQGLEAMVRDPVGAWILQPRRGAAAECAVTSWAERRTTVRVDRTFRAGAEPLSTGTECLWIVDYKTGTHGREGIEAFLGAEREKYRGQMEAYARTLATEGEVARVGLYFPTMARLVWWQPQGV